MNDLILKASVLSFYEILVYFCFFQAFLILCALVFFVQPEFLLRVKNQWVKNICSVIGLIFLFLNFVCAILCGVMYQLYLHSGFGG